MGNTLKYTCLLDVETKKALRKFNGVIRNFRLIFLINYTFLVKDTLL